LEYQWDYMIKVYKSKELEAPAFEGTLKELGRLGWELISIQGLSGQSATLFFKRPLRSEGSEPYSQPDGGKLAYLPQRPKPEPPAALATEKKLPSAADISSLYPGNSRFQARDGEPPAPREIPAPMRQFGTILESCVVADESVLKTLKKNEKQGIALTDRRLILVKEETWGNPKVVALDYRDIIEMDLRHFLGKYDLSVKFYDRKNDFERIEVMSLEHEHIPALVDIVRNVIKEAKGTSHSIELQGFSLKP
jgi:hypothetical protein